MPTADQLGARRFEPPAVPESAEPLAAQGLVQMAPGVYVVGGLQMILPLVWYVVMKEKDREEVDHGPFTTPADAVAWLCKNMTDITTMSLVLPRFGDER